MDKGEDESREKAIRDAKNSARALGLSHASHGGTMAEGLIQVSAEGRRTLRRASELHEEGHREAVREARRRILGYVKLTVTLMTDEEWAEVVEARERRLS